jgi:WD40 repeat protein
MNEPPLQKIERLFHEAARLEPAQRSAFLDAQCGGDLELKKAVEDLLAHDNADEHGEGFLESPIVRRDAETSIVVQAQTSSTGTALPPEFPGENAIPGYQLLERLGYGGMGVVYKARQLGLNRTVAIKMLLAGPHITAEHLERFRTEAATLARLQHPNIVQIHEVGEWQGRPYFAMEYVPGPSLAGRLDGLPQSQSYAVQLIEVLARAIHTVHRHGIIHRDLKPANILFTVDPWEQSENREFRRLRSGESLTPKITDFGVAKDVTSTRDLTQTGQAMGTPAYMAPEQAQGKANQVGPTTDVYALGAILYELLTGRAPFAAATSAEVFSRLLTEEPLSPARLVPKLARDLETICLKCLEKDPHQRYATALELAEDLHRYQVGRPIKARPIRFIERAWRWCRRQPLAAASLAGVVILLVALITTILIYDAKLRQALAQSQQTAEEERQHLVRLDIEIGVRDLNEGNALRALLWFSDALNLDQGDAQQESRHRQRIAAVLRESPDLLELGFYDQPVMQSRVAKDGSWAVTAAADGTVQIWNVQTGQAEGPKLKHDSPVDLVEFSRDGRLLATATRDEKVHIWDVATGREVAPSVETGGKVRRMAFQARGRLLIQRADYSVRLRDVANRELVSPPGLPQQAPRYSAMSEDGSSVFSLDDNGAGRVVNVSTGRTTKLPSAAAPGMDRAEFSPDGHWLGLMDPNNVVWLWDTTKGAWLGEPLRHTRAVSCICFSPDGKRVLTASEDGTAQVWEIDKPQPPISLSRHEPVIEYGQFSLDGRHLLTVSADKMLRVWDAATGKALTPRLSHDNRFGHAQFGADGQQLLVVESPGYLRMWRLSQRAAHTEQVEERQPSELALLAQVLSGYHIDESGVPSRLVSEDLRTAWTRMRRAQLSAKR